MHLAPREQRYYNAGAGFVSFGRKGIGMNEENWDRYLAILGNAMKYNPETGDFYYPRTGEVVSLFKDRKGYLIFSVPRKFGSDIKAHRLAWRLYYGEWPKREMDIDHINEVKSDNRISNLRQASRSENMMNQTKAKSSNITGLIGVALNKRSKNKPYRAQITRNRKQIGLGVYKTAEEAHLAYLAAKKVVHGVTSTLQASKVEGR